MKNNHVIKEVKCKECNTYFRKICTLKMHERRMHLKQIYTYSFECSICNKKCLTYLRLARHVQNFHSAAEKLKITCLCDHCNEKYVSRLHMEIHMKTIHSGPYRCFDLKCQKRFMNPAPRRSHFKIFHSRDVAELQRLERQEFGFLPHKCLHQSCDKRYKNRHNMLSHYRTHSVVSRFE